MVKTELSFVTKVYGFCFQSTFKNLEMFHLFHCCCCSPNNHQMSPRSSRHPPNWPPHLWPFSSTLASLHFLTVLSILAPEVLCPGYYSFWKTLPSESHMACFTSLVSLDNGDLHNKVCPDYSFQIADRHFLTLRSHSADRVLPFFHKSFIFLYTV